MYVHKVKVLYSRVTFIAEAAVWLLNAFNGGCGERMAITL
jgi:hypothetical protein